MEMYLILGFLLLAFLALIRQTTGGHVLTGSAKVVSRRVELAKFAGSGWNPNNGWNYLVTFRLSDGEEIELYVFENEYKVLTEGLAGELRWHKDTVSEFIPDMEVTV